MEVNVEVFACKFAALVEDEESNAIGKVVVVDSRACVIVCVDAGLFL